MIAAERHFMRSSSSTICSNDKSSVLSVYRGVKGVTIFAGCIEEAAGCVEDSCLTEFEEEDVLYVLCLMDKQICSVEVLHGLYSFIFLQQIPHNPHIYTKLVIC